MAAKLSAEEREQRQREHQGRWYRKNRDQLIAKALARQAAKHHPRFDPAQSEAARLDPVMSYDEIAAVLGVSKARVGQLVEKALRKLRARFPQLRELLR